MLSTIKFDYQLLFKADEINDIRWNWMLPSEFESAEVAIFQVQPKAQFCVG